MPAKVRCKNCRLEFPTDDPSRLSECPRCSSKNLDIQREPRDLAKAPGAPGSPGASGSPSGSADSAKRVYTSSGIIYGDTKEAWKSFHHSESKGCPKCGGTEFERNFKRKEKVCKKCGEILPLARRFS